MTTSIFAEEVETEFQIDDEILHTRQILIHILGSEFILDPDQADVLLSELTESLYKNEGK